MTTRVEGVAALTLVYFVSAAIVVWGLVSAKAFGSPFAEIAVVLAVPTAILFGTLFFALLSRIFEADWDDFFRRIGVSEND